MLRSYIKFLLIAVIFFISESGFSQLQKSLSYEDVFQLEYTSDPQISPDGSSVVYRRTGFDIMTDRSKGNLLVGICRWNFTPKAN